MNRSPEDTDREPTGTRSQASRTSILGIVNITEDSFSDGNKYLVPAEAIAHARALSKDGADIIDLGAAASNPQAKSVPAEQEIARLAPVLAALKQDGVAVSIDTFSPVVQRWALSEGADYLNDIQGFPFSELYPELAASRARLIVMHSVQGQGRATRISVEPSEIVERIVSFFDQRLFQLERAGIARARLILDPGMGLFLGTRREASFEVLHRLAELKKRFGLPLLVSVSRKSFLRTFLNRSPEQAGPASLAAELYAAIAQGADFVRTHAPGALKDALVVWRAINRD